MRRHKLILTAAVLAGACTLLTKFDPEGQPCDPGQTDPELQCLSDAGFHCVQGFCRLVPGQNDGGKDAGPSDAATDSGLDSGFDGGADAGDAGKPDAGDAGKPDGGRDGGDGG